MSRLLRRGCWSVCFTLLWVQPWLGKAQVSSEGSEKPAAAHSGHTHSNLAPSSKPAFPEQMRGSKSGLTLEALERMALERNPTLAQAAAEIRAAEGRRMQAGLYPNPTVGYAGEEISFGPVMRGGEHGFLLQQNIVTAGKLALSRRVFAMEQNQLEALAKAQRQRVLNTVRILYYQALGAERVVEMRNELARIAREAVATSHQLFNVGQADQPDVLEAEIEAERTELGLFAAQNERARVWRQLSAVVGDPSLEYTPLAGEIDEALPELDPEAALQTILRESPEVEAAQAAVERAEVALKRARVEKIPDIQVRGGLRYNRELLERGGRPVGREGILEVSVELPIFNRNQGNVKAAEAELARARHQVERVKLNLRARFARAFREYSDYLLMAGKYNSEMLPRAQKAHEMYLSRFREMAAAYPQVVIARRNFFQLRENYATVLVNLWRADVEIRGLLLVDGLDSAGMVGDFSSWGQESH